MSLDEHTKTRVNAALLPNFHGKRVSLIGISKNVASGGNSFTLTSCDNKDVQVQMLEPITERVSGLVEVQGRVLSRNTIEGENLIVFPEEATDKFDMALYQKAIELSIRCSNLYIQGGQAED